MARTVRARYDTREAAQDAAHDLIVNGVPREDIAQADGEKTLSVTTDAVLGSAVYDILRRHGSPTIEVAREYGAQSGWERLDPSNDPPLGGGASSGDWGESSKLGTASGAAAGAATGAALGGVAGPLGAVVGGVAGAIVGGAVGAAGDIAGKTAEEAVDDDEKPEEPTGDR